MSNLYSFEKFQEHWQQEPIVIVDTNGLLNIYRYSTEATEHILKVLDLTVEKVWIPAQVLEEFNNNHRSVVSDEKKKFKEVKSEVGRITAYAKNDFEKQFLRFSKFKFPKVTDLHTRIEALINQIIGEASSYEEYISDEIQKNAEMLKQEKVKKFVEQLILSDSVGQPYGLSTLLKIYTEGEQRYKYLIPPGYKDIEKDKTDPTKRKKYGDLLIWKQVLDHAKDKPKPIIFITNDEKEDWWEFDKKQKPTGPRNELLSEFKEVSAHEFIMMGLNDFIDHLSKINRIFDIRTHLEMSSENVSRDLIEIKGLDVHLSSSDLQFYLIHSGELQDHLENALEDVEIEEYILTHLDINASIEDDHINYTGRFEGVLEATITEGYSKNYNESFAAAIAISGSISLDFKVDLEKEEEYIISETITIKFGGFEVESVNPYFHEEYEEEEVEHSDDGSCVVCGKEEAPYFTGEDMPICEQCSSRRECCPNCGRFFKIGTLPGAFCITCEQEKS
jgi:hypothetical protein